MRNVLVKDLFREIKTTLGRFISILAIVAVGCGFFAGLKSSCPDMKITAQKYYRDTNLADFHIMSILGFDSEDVGLIKQRSDVKAVMPSYSVDAFLDCGAVSGLSVKVLSYNQSYAKENELINSPVLVSGRLPENSGECVLEESAYFGQDAKIGNRIHLYLKNSDIDDYLKLREFEIVGFVRSSSYVSFQHGNTTIGDGKLDGYMYINENDFSLDVYTDVYLTLNGASELSPFEDDYKDLITLKSDELEGFSEKASKRRYDVIWGEANDKITDAKTQLADAEKESKEELDKAKKELDDGLKKLQEGQSEYENGVKTFNSEIADAEKQIEDNRVKLENARAEYYSGLQKYQSGYDEFVTQKEAALKTIAEYETQLAGINAQIEENEPKLASALELTSATDAIVEKYKEVTADYSQLPVEEIQSVTQFAYLISSVPNESGTLTPDEILSAFAGYIGAPAENKPMQYGYLKAMLQEVNNSLSEQMKAIDYAKSVKTQLEQGINSGYYELEQAENELISAKNQLDYALGEIESGEAALADARKTLDTEREKGIQELKDAELKLIDAEKEYNDGLKKYEDGKTEAEEEIAKAHKEILDAENKLSDIPEAKWYVFDRNQNPGYSTYQEDAEKVDAISAVFPFFFVLVAALVCSTTMSRMIEEQRIQIGTLKALGYGNGKIISKYIIYAVLASLTGSTVGLLIGFQLFPKVIINAYGIMYRFPSPITPFRWDYAVACTVVGILCTGVTAFVVAYRSLKIVPAQLMRPKPPKNGKRVLMERISFLWNKLSFSYKVTVRNIGRYKKRSFMTIVGIAGCTALILTGFGLQHAISVIIDRQFEYVYVTDATVIVEDNVEDFRGLTNRVESVDGVEAVAPIVYKSIDVSSLGDKTVSVNLVVPETTDNFSDFIILKNRQTGKEVTLDSSGVVINEKLAKILSLKVGDYINIDFPDGENYSAKVTALTENYAYNYVYMLPELYKEACKTDTVGYNAYFLNKKDGADNSQISEALLENEEILGFSFTEDMSKTFEDTVKSLNNIVLLIIVSAGALALIVMYNLVNININERRHELATIKVLGFYDSEVSAYIYRENNMCVAIGVLAGLVLGIFLEKFVVATAEVDAVMFATDINAFSFIMAAALTIFFAAIVTFILHFKLKKISMVESMKAIE